MTPCTADLLALISDLKDALEFDSANCDFGPAYGLWDMDKKDALRRARSILKSTKFKRQPKQRAKPVKDRFADNDIPF